MKNVAFVLVAILGLTACTMSPEDRAVAFLDAVGNQDFEEAKKHCTQQTGALLDALVAMAPDEVKSIEKKEYTIVSSVETGETAEVTYMEEGATESAVLPMKKVDGEWLVDISKDKEDTGGGEEEVGIEEEVPTEDITETEAVATEEVVE
jgi:hypothetical protein